MFTPFFIQRTTSQPQKPPLSALSKSNKQGLYQIHQLTGHLCWLKRPLASLLILQLEQLVTAINALLSVVFPTPKIDHEINRLGIIFSPFLRSNT